MSVLIPLCFPNTRLTQAALPIEQINTSTKKLADDLVATMYQYQLIGMAATHVGVMQQMIVIDISVERNRPQIFINPKIIEQQGKITAKEAGIAIPNIEIDVERASWIKITALNLAGKEIIVEAENLFARVLQHEIDQMNGILFIDRISKLKRDRIVKKFSKKPI